MTIIRVKTTSEQVSL